MSQQNDTPIDETPIDETPIDDTPIDDTPIDDTPIDDTPIDDTPIDESTILNTNIFLHNITNSIYNNTFFNQNGYFNQSTYLSPPLPPSSSPLLPPSSSPPPPPSSSPPPPPSSSPPPPPSSSPPPPPSSRPPPPPSSRPPPLPPRRNRILPQIPLVFNEIVEPDQPAPDQPAPDQPAPDQPNTRFFLRPNSRIRFHAINPDGTFGQGRYYNILQNTLAASHLTVEPPVEEPVVDEEINSIFMSTIQRSFDNDTDVYKDIISDEGKKMLKSVAFSSLETEEKKCSIMQEDFTDDMAVIQLPCKHVFCEEGIIHWLENESASCPICRYKLPSNEVRNDKSEERVRSASEPQTYSNYYQSIINNIIRTHNRHEEEDTQQAIWNSIIQGNSQS